MSHFEAFILGLVQGLAEFLPISSSGHTTLLQMLFGISEAPQILNIMLHFGTLIVVLIVYRERIWEMIRHPLASDLKWLILATLPTVVAALTVKDAIDAVLTTEKFLGIGFIVSSFIMLVGDGVSRLHQDKHRDVRWYDALVMGCMQVLAIAPGVTRSGSTISGGMFTGLNRRRAVDFAFLMSVPAVCGSVVLELKDVHDAAELAGVGFTQQLTALVEQLGGVGPVLIAVSAALLAGYLSIKLMLSIVKKYGLRWFAVYTFLIGGFLIARQILGF
ncbi:MAG: undecaprenyl-diphosphate phosphatase [Clostridia bacterium]|nr:undecaprenyl-diphosphate phosphatase [Clostridia bacterium]